MSYAPNVDYMTSFSDWLAVQNGNFGSLQNQIDPVLRYRHRGRDMAAFTHVDVLYQAYFTAFLVLASMGAPVNPGILMRSRFAKTGLGRSGCRILRGRWAKWRPRL